MKIKQDPVTGLWAREDGAVLMPPSCRGGTHYRWTFGSLGNHGYLVVRHKGRAHLVHRIVCRAFHGLPPEGKPEVDHISRVKSANFALNLRWISRKGNANNRDFVNKAFEKYGVRACEDKKAYDKAHAARYSDEKRTQGLGYRKGPDGKHHWLPCIRTKPAV